MKLMQRISRARTRLLMLTPFFGHLALKLRPRAAEAGDGVDTAAVAVDGTLVVSEPWAKTLTDAHLAGLLAHEVLHVALGHFERGKELGELIWGRATDYSINLLIEELVADLQEGPLQLPPDALLDWGYAGLTSEEIADRLLDAPHEHFDRDMRVDLAESDDGLAAARGEVAAAERLRAEWRVALVAAARAHEAARGDLPESIRRLVGDVVGPAKLDWRTQLSVWIGEHGRRTDWTYMRPSRRSESAGVLLPSLRRPTAPEVAVLVDTSGSMSAERLREALSEIGGICGDLGIGVRVLVVDAELHDDLQVDDAIELVDRLVGGGGSDLRPAFARLRDDGFTGVVVAITDGATSVPAVMPENLRAVLWVVREGDPVPTTAYGSVLRLPTERGAGV